MIIKNGTVLNEDFQFSKKDIKISNGLIAEIEERLNEEDEVWDADPDTAPRAVDVYMTKLRAKLSHCEDFEIKTVHGLGYKAVIK